MTNETVIAIKQDLLDGQLSQREIAKKHEVAQSSVSYIASGKLHADVGPSVENAPSRACRSLVPEVRNVYLEGEVERLRKENSRLKREVKTSSANVYTISSLCKELGQQLTPIRVPKTKIPERRSNSIVESAVLALSDLHADSVVRPNEVDGLEDFNFPVCVGRARQLVREVIKFTQISLQGFHFDELVVLGLGDYTSGTIHEYENYFPDQFTANLAIGELIGLMLAELSQYFPLVRFQNVCGNHGRVTEKIEFDRKGIRHNHDTMIARIAELYCRTNPRIQFDFPESMSSICRIKNSFFHLTHGHGKKQGAAIWNRAKLNGQKFNSLHHGQIDYFVSGHYHTPGEIQISGGASMLCNGAFLATDAYAYQSLGECGMPSQLLFGCHAKNKATWRLPVYLDSANVGGYPSLERFYADS